MDWNCKFFDQKIYLTCSTKIHCFKELSIFINLSTKFWIYSLLLSKSKVLTPNTLWFWQILNNNKKGFNIIYMFFRYKKFGLDTLTVWHVLLFFKLCIVSKKYPFASIIFSCAFSDVLILHVKRMVKLVHVNLSRIILLHSHIRTPEYR